jgi:hypothetical protein
MPAAAIHNVCYSPFSFSPLSEWIRRFDAMTSFNMPDQNEPELLDLS